MVDYIWQQFWNRQYDPLMDNVRNGDTYDDGDGGLSRHTTTTTTSRIIADAVSSSATKIDYNVLSVAAMTLALIMMVEVVRHKLDHYAATTSTSSQANNNSSSNNKIFFRAVLEGVYAECTLLIVSSSVFPLM